MDHGPAIQCEKDNASEYKSKLGLFLFVIYLAIYTGFVIINTVKPKLMEIKMFLGLNLAVVYGFGLIILAIVLGLIYNAMCSSAEARMNTEEDAKEVKE